MNFWEISRWSGKIIVIDQENQKRWYVDEIQKYVDDLKLITKSSTRKGLVMIICNNNIECILSYLANLQIGNATMLISATLNNEHINALIEIYKPEMIFCSNVFKAPSTYRLTYELFNYVLLQSTNQNGCQFEIHKDLALLLATSGSTGSPKFTRLSYKNLQENARSIAKCLGLTKKERAITTLPMTYSYGLSIINSHLFVGGKILLTQESITNKSFWDFAQKQSVTSLAGVPYTYEVLKRMNLKKIAPTSLTTLTQAGGKLGLKLAEHFYQLAKEKKWKFFIMYGQTEATARISCLPIEEMAGRLTSIGKPIPGGKLEIDKKNNELVYSGPNVMMGYASNRDDLSSGDTNRSTLRTGDIAQKDQDGFYYITGRNKRFIKLHGMRINLDSVEHELKKYFDSSFVCGGTDKQLYVFNKSGEENQQVKQFLFDKFKIHHTNIKFYQLDKLPLNENNKVDYHKLNKMVVA